MGQGTTPGLDSHTSLQASVEVISDRIQYTISFILYGFSISTLLQAEQMETLLPYFLKDSMID
jgi:hypothetical protein